MMLSVAYNVMLIVKNAYQSSNRFFMESDWQLMPSFGTRLNAVMSMSSTIQQERREAYLEAVEETDGLQTVVTMSKDVRRFWTLVIRIFIFNERLVSVIT